MFTGLIEEMGQIEGIAGGISSSRLRVACRLASQDLRAGDSVAVNGACLTAADVVAGSVFIADVMAETLARTNLGQLKVGDNVNLERALRLGDRLGGHLVSGHIDATGRVLSREREGIATLLTVGHPQELWCYITAKGSVALDGVSLTVVGSEMNCLVVSLIPHTLRVTTLSQKRIGDRVNLEVDVLAKYIQKLLAKPETGGKTGRAGENLTFEYLRERGFA